MAGIDNSIYFQQKTPDIMGSIEKGMSMRDMLDKRALEKKQLAEADSIKSAYGAGIIKNADGSMGIDQGKTLSAIAAVNPQKAFEAQQQFQSQDMAKQKAQLENQMKQVQMTGQLLGGVKDQATWTQALQQAQKMGIDVSQLPQSFDQNFVNNLNYRTMTSAERLANEHKQFDQNIATERLGIDKARLGIDRQKAATAAKAPDIKLTEAEKAVDKKYADNYNNFTSKGKVNATAAIERLEAIASELENDTGFGEAGGTRFEKMVPDAFRSRDAIRRRDMARNAANTTLKELFGGQLSDGERDAAAKEYYNDALDNKTNAATLRDKIKQLKGTLSSEDQKAKYYEANRTLQGFKMGDVGIKKNNPGENTLVLKTSQIDWAE